MNKSHQRFNAQVERKRAAFSNYNTIRMREAIRYLTPEKFTLFLQIPFLLHINAEHYPGFIPQKPEACGIWNFQNSGFYKLAVKEKIFPKSIQEFIKIKNPCIQALYHIGSLGTFTQSYGSDFDYWVMIDKKQFSQNKYANLERKLDTVVKYSREEYDQEVTFFIMDVNSVKRDDNEIGHMQDTVAIPRIFLKEEFYRTYLMIAGKIPVWSVLPSLNEDKVTQQRMSTQALAYHPDLIQIGLVHAFPYTDILKALLWHISKSIEDPVKALIKATMVFSYAFGDKTHKMLLCDQIKQGYADAGIDDYSLDPYKVVFDRILDFHEKCDPDGIHLIKNAIFFRLCEYPNVILPKEGTPKWQLFNHYISHWKLKVSQINKLLSYSTWAESEKLLLEKAILNRLAHMSNHAIAEVKDPDLEFATESGKSNWQILKNKTRMRLREIENKIENCSIFLRKQDIRQLLIEQTASGWRLIAQIGSDDKKSVIFKHQIFAHVFAWILENNLYQRHYTQFKGRIAYKIYETPHRALGFDALYMAAVPVKPMYDKDFLVPPTYKKLFVFLFTAKTLDLTSVIKAELLAVNTWGELFADTVELDAAGQLSEALVQIAEKMALRAEKNTRLYIYQLGTDYIDDIDNLLKKEFEEAAGIVILSGRENNRPYLDKL